MSSKEPLVELIRLSSELVRESARLKIRAKETISQSASIMERSRSLLSMWPVSGTPVLRRTYSEETAVAPHENPGRTNTETATGKADAVLERLVEKNFTGESVRLDGRHFIDCIVENCVLEYCGGPVVLEGTSFTGCRFHFGGDAAMTVAVLSCFGLVEEGHAGSVLSSAQASGAPRVN